MLLTLVHSTVSSFRPGCSQLQWSHNFAVSLLIEAKLWEIVLPNLKIIWCTREGTTHDEKTSEKLGPMARTCNGKRRFQTLYLQLSTSSTPILLSIVLQYIYSNMVTTNSSSLESTVLYSWTDWPKSGEGVKFHRYARLIWRGALFMDYLNEIW